MSWRVRPSLGAALHAVEVPAVWGDTLVADMCAAYDGLDPDLQAQIDGLSAVLDFSMVFGHTVKPEDRAAMREQYPPVEHASVRTHPDTGRKLISLNRFLVDHIVGMERDASNAPIDRLARTAETVEYPCRFRWEEHSVAFWDNRAVHYYAVSDYWPERRVMERASIVGEPPI